MTSHSKPPDRPISYDGRAIIYKEKPLPLLLRLFALILGVGLCLVIPAPFIIHTDWTTLSWTAIIVVFCICFPVVVGGFFILIGLVSATELRLDPASGYAMRILRGPLVNRSERLRLSDFGAPEIVIRESEDGPYAILRLSLPKGKKLDMACFDSEEDARHWRDRVEAVLSGK